LEGSAMHRDDIQKLGANAARQGLTLWDCPYYRAVEMPGHTGESISLWREKVRAWEAGWRMQMRSRPTPARDRAHQLVAMDRSAPVVLRTG
jgi:hypothetical protein